MSKDIASSKTFNNKCPASLNIKENENGDITIIVRSQGENENNNSVAKFEMTREEFKILLDEASLAMSKPVNQDQRELT